MDSQAGNADGNKAFEEYLGRWGVRLLVLRGECAEFQTLLATHLHHPVLQNLWE